MAEEKRILNELKRFFGDSVIEPEDKMPFDYIIKAEGSTILCYVVIKGQDIEDDKYLIDIAKRIRDYATNEVPVVLIKDIKGDLMVGLLCYWEYGRYMYNRDINWRPLDYETIDWLQVQLRAKRMNIRLLPDKFFRFIKTIRLNVTMLTDAEIVYFRRVTEKYRMQPDTSITDIERFNRLLKGTPEEEFPKDELDELILKKVQEYYPSASIKTRSMLCETELLDLRLYKDKLCNRDFLTFKDVYGNISRIALECYYYPNFRYIRNKPMVSDMDIVAIKDRNLCESYEPLSALNI